MPLQILIGGVDYTQYVEPDSNFKIEQNIAVNSDNATLYITIPQQALPRPKGGQEIKIINGGTIEFGGVILNPHEVMIAPDRMQYQTTCRDYVYWFNKYLVTNTYQGWTYEQIIRDVVSRCPGFTANNAQNTGTVIPTIKFDHKYPSDVMKQLADQIAWQWWIDYSKDVHFGATGLFPSPLPNNTFLPDTDTQNYDSLEFDEDVSQLRNQIYLTGFKVPAAYTYTDSVVADGQTTSFPLTYEPKHQLNSITAMVGGVKQKNVMDISGGTPDNQMADGNAYINYSNQTVRYNVAPAQGTVVSTTYYPMFENLKMYNDPNAFNVMKQRDLMDGVYEYAERDQQLTNNDSSIADLKGQYELLQYAYPHVSGTFNSYLQGWRAGQFFYMTSNKRMDGQFQNQKFYVIKVDKAIATAPAGQAPVLYSQITFSDTPYST